ncbi:MAG: hypothetical protein KAJ51_11380 [Thermoplasmata archaeon]|nr:hypothetical protein [Thermoplasmata archaeon]
MQKGATNSDAAKETAISIAQVAKEAEEITDLLEALKEELERKEALLAKVEETLEETENVLESKIEKIVEKDQKLKKIEESLVNKDGELNKIEDLLQRKGEDVAIQEEELQTNAALEYLSFRTREEDLILKETDVTEKTKLIENVENLDEIVKMIEEKEHELGEIEKNLRAAVEAKGIEIGDLTAADLEGFLKRDEELKRREEELKIRIEHMGQVEKRVREEEEELRNEAVRLREKLTDTDSFGSVELERKETELKTMENELLKSQKEIASFKQALEKLEITLKEREEDVKYREMELEKEREGIMQKAGMDKGELAQAMASEDEIKFQIDKELKKREREIEDKVKRKSDIRAQQLMKKIEMLETRNDELETLEDRLESARAEIEVKDTQLSERFDEIAYMEQKIAKREQRLLDERYSVEEERKKLQAATGIDGSAIDDELKLKTEELEIMERKMKEREEFLRQKESEMERLEAKLIDADIEMEAAVEAERDVTKIKTGVRRIDDLLYGGFPPNSNILVYGPPYTGKLTFINNFIVQGLRKGVPAVFILTDKTPDELKDSLKVMLPKIEAIEKKGLLKYVDAFSKSMGLDTDNPNAIYIENTTDMEEISMAVSNIQKTLPADIAYHKTAFYTLSTIMRYSDPMSTFRFLQILSSRNKRARAASVYCLDQGMFNESDVQTLKSLMGGVLEFKKEDVKTFLRVEGIGDVRTPRWIEYSHTPKDIIIRGSFAEDHIR